MSIDDHGAFGPVTLSSRAAPQGQAVLAQVEGYWRSLRGHRRLPLRSDVDPSRIEAALPHAFIVERVAPGVARMRVSGQALSQHLGADARGMPISAFFTAAARPALRGHLDRVFDDPAIVELPVLAARGAFRQPQTGRLLLLPLLGSDDEASRALGALLLDGAAVARGPRQFDIPADGPVRCERVLAPAPVIRRIANADAAGPAPAAAPLSAAPRSSERPWLKLVVSNA